MIIFLMKSWQKAGRGGSKRRSSGPPSSSGVTGCTRFENPGSRKEGGKKALRAKAVFSFFLQKQHKRSYMFPLTKWWTYWYSGKLKVHKVHNKDNWGGGVSSSCLKTDVLFSRPDLAGLTAGLLWFGGSCRRRISLFTKAHALSHPDKLSPGNFIPVTSLRPWAEGFFGRLCRGLLKGKNKGNFEDSTLEYKVLFHSWSPSVLLFPQPRAHKTAGAFYLGLPRQWEVTPTSTCVGKRHGESWCSLWF